MLMAINSLLYCSGGVDGNILMAEGSRSLPRAWEALGSNPYQKFVWSPGRVQLKKDSHTRFHPLPIVLEGSGGGLLWLRLWEVLMMIVNCCDGSVRPAESN